MDIDYLADRPGHIPELARWHRDEWGHMRPGQTLDQRIELLTLCCGRGSIPTVVVGTDADGLIGSAMLVEHDMSTRKDLSPWLAGVFVRPDRRGQGAATRLIGRVEQEAAALDVKRLFLYTDREAEFYGRRGWDVHEQCDYRGVGVTIMSKVLAPAGA